MNFERLISPEGSVTAIKLALMRRFNAMGQYVIL